MAVLPAQLSNFQHKRLADNKQPCRDRCQQCAVTLLTTLGKPGEIGTMWCTNSVDHQAALLLSKREGLCLASTICP
jgi:hypothetical protein